MNFRSDLKEGFLELLEIAGQPFLYQELEFLGILNKKQADPQQFDLSIGDDNAVEIRVLKIDFPPDLKVIGESFNDEAGNIYRINRIHNSPDQVILKLECVINES